MKASLALSSSLAIRLAAALVWEDGTGKLPAMGWNSWNAYECDINATVFLTQAQAMIDLGLQDAGYEYVNLDDCWSVKSGRDATTGQLVPDPDRFPDGISGLADTIHDMGFKLGIYSSAGTLTCADYPASIGNEELDAATWAAWGVDYLKYDNCNVPSDQADECDACTVHLAQPENFYNGSCTGTDGICPAGYNYTASNTASRYRAMRDALAAQNRTIQYSICVWGYAGVAEWGNQTGNSWRMSTDIQPRWNYVTAIAATNAFLLNSVDFWGHNDADMLEVGNGALSAAETRSHFALWAAMKSPLMIGTDLTALEQADLDVLLNSHLLAFHQDAVYGAPATPYKWGDDVPDWTFDTARPPQYWAGASSQGTLVLLLNAADNGTADMTVDFAEVPFLEANGTYDVRDAWTGDCLGSFTDGVTMSVEAHDTAVLVFQQCTKRL